MPDITDRVFGCLVGGAIGDALGATVEGWSYRRIRAEFDRVEEFRPYNNPHSTGKAGSVTDDSVLSHYLAHTIAESGGRITPEDYAEVLCEHLNPDRVWITEEIVHQKLLAGISPWRSGIGTIPAATATTAIAPVGIINAADPRQAYQDGVVIAGVTQDGVERDAAGTVAAGIAEAITPDATVQDVVDVMREFSVDQVYRAIDLTADLVAESTTIDEFVASFYDQLLDWRWPAVEWDKERYYEGEIFSGSSLEILPVVIALLELTEGDANEAIIEGASFGRDCDTIGHLTGNIAGALRGAESIRDGWISEVERTNRDFFEELTGSPESGFEVMADRLVNALEAERDRFERRRTDLANLLSNGPV